jgi:hypothetical protein
MTQSPAFTEAEILARFPSEIYPHSLAFAGQERLFHPAHLPGKTVGCVDPRRGRCAGRVRGAVAGRSRRRKFAVVPVRRGQQPALRAMFPALQPRLLSVCRHPSALATVWGWPRPGTCRRCWPPAVRSRPSSHNSPSARMRARTAPRRKSSTMLPWGAFQAGWRGPVGADADHLKQPADADVCAAAGYSMYNHRPRRPRR